MRPAMSPAMTGLVDRCFAQRPVERLRDASRGNFKAVAPGPSAAVLQGLAVGVRGNIPDRLWDHSRSRGSLISSQSRACMSRAARCRCSPLLRLMWRIPRLARLSARLVIECVAGGRAATAAYAWLSGASLPALRTLATVAVLAVLRWLRRSLPFAQVLAFAAFVLVATDPLAVTSTGFWLSFVATAVLVALVVRETRWRGKLEQASRKRSCRSRRC